MTKQEVVKILRGNGVKLTGKEGDQELLVLLKLGLAKCRCYLANGEFVVVKTEE